MSKHTPGPWLTVETKIEENKYISIDQELPPAGGHVDIALIPFDWTTDEARQNAIANARLIAAAPKLKQFALLVRGRDGLMNYLKQYHLDLYVMVQTVLDEVNDGKS